MEFIYIIILLTEKSIWERFYICKFLVRDAKEFYIIVASGWDTILRLISFTLTER